MGTTNVRRKRVFRFLTAVLAALLLMTFADLAEAKTKTSSVKLYADSATQKSMTLKASGLKAKKAKWKTSKKTVVTITKKGKATAKKKGKATITAKQGKNTYKFKVTVKNVSISKKSATVQAGKTVKVTLVGDKIKSANTSDAKVAIVASNGTVTGVKAGTATITLTSKKGKKYTCKVTVTAAPATTVAVTGVAFARPELQLEMGSGATANPATVSPSNATDKKVTYTSSDTGVATVDASGNVQPVAAGVATITATAGGKNATCTVTVIKSEPKDLVVDNVQDFANALGSEDEYKSITLNVQSEESFEITGEDRPNTSLIINAPKSSISNHVKFSEVTIKAIDADTYTEYAGNIINFEAETGHIVIDGEAKGSTVNVEESVKNVTIENNGQLDGLNIQTDGEVTIIGGSDQAAVVTNVSAPATVKTSVVLDITITMEDGSESKAKLVLGMGAEAGTEVTVTSVNAIPEVSGIGTIVATVVDPGDSGNVLDTQTIIAENDGSQTSSEEVDVTGTIYDATTSDAIDGASVALYAWNAAVANGMVDGVDPITSVSTDSNGAYVLSNIPVGNYVLLVSAEGYVSATSDLLLANASADKDVHLTPEHGDLRVESINENDFVTSYEIDGSDIKVWITEEMTPDKLDRISVNVANGTARAIYDESNDEYLIVATSSDGDTRTYVLTFDYDYSKLEITGFEFNDVVTCYSIHNGWIMLWATEYEFNDYKEYVKPILKTSDIEYSLYQDEEGWPHIDITRGGLTRTYSFFVEHDTWNGLRISAFAENDVITSKTYFDYEEVDVIYIYTSAFNADEIDVEALTEAFAKYAIVSRETATVELSYDMFSGWSATVSDDGESHRYSVSVIQDWNGLEVVDIPVNGTITDSYYDAISIMLRVTNSDYDVWSADLRPEFGTNGVDWGVAWDDEQGCYVLTMTKGDLSHTVPISIIRDWGDFVVTDIPVRGVITDGECWDSDDEIILYTTNSDYEAWSADFEPEFGTDGVDWSVAWDNEQGCYVLTMTKGDLSRTYLISIVKDWGGFAVTDIPARGVITEGECRDSDDEIVLYTTNCDYEAWSADFEPEFGTDGVDWSVAWDNEQGCYVLTMTKGDLSRTYLIWIVQYSDDLAITRIPINGVIVDSNWGDSTINLFVTDTDFDAWSADFRPVFSTIGVDWDVAWDDELGCYVLYMAKEDQSSTYSIYVHYSDDGQDEPSPSLDDILRGFESNDVVTEVSQITSTWADLVVTNLHFDEYRDYIVPIFANGASYEYRIEEDQRDKDGFLLGTSYARLIIETGKNTYEYSLFLRPDSGSNAYWGLTLNGVEDNGVVVGSQCYTESDEYLYLYATTNDPNQIIEDFKATFSNSEATYTLTYHEPPEEGGEYFPFILSVTDGKIVRAYYVFPEVIEA